VDRGTPPDYPQRKHANQLFGNYLLESGQEFLDRCADLDYYGKNPESNF